MNLRIEEGKYYWNRANEIVGPISANNCDTYIWKDNNDTTYSSDGLFYVYDNNSGLNLIREVKIEKENVMSEFTVNDISMSNGENTSIIP